MNSTLQICAASAALTLALAAPAQADLITWGVAVDSTAATDVSTNGTTVTARTLNPSTVFVSPTVNGVTFSNFAPSGWNNGGLTLNGSTSGDAGYDDLLDGQRAGSFSTGNPTGWGGIRLDTLGTLTMGNTYEIQVWFSEQRPGGNPANPINDRVMTFSSVAGAVTLVNGEVTNLGSLTQGSLSGPVEADPNNMSGAGDTIFGQHLIGTFTRTSSDPLYLLVQGSHPLAVNLRAALNGFQVREIPTVVDSSFCFGDGGDGMGCTDCPCGNNAASGALGGCLNSAGSSAELVDSGNPIVGADTLRFEVLGAAPTTFGILVSGDNQLPAMGPCPVGSGLAGLPALDGLRCVGGAALRHGTRPTDANGDIGVTNNGWGTPSGPAGGLIASSGFTAGQTRHFQCFYREDVLSGCMTGQNTTQGVTVTFQ